MAEFWATNGAWIGMGIGALASYFGSQNAMREDLARVRGRAEEAITDAAEAKSAANGAHTRIDNLLMRK